MSGPDSALSPKLAKVLLALIVLAHVGLASWFAVITPYRTGGFIFSSRHAFVKDIGAPDERQHVNYVSHLLQGEGFPVFDPKDPNLYEDYQSHQPPAFYLLADVWCHLTGASDLENRDDGLKLRFLNCLLGGVEVVAVFCLGAWGFRRYEIGILGAAFAAFLPMNVALSGAVSNDVLLFTLCTFSLAVCARSIQNGWTTKAALLVGVLVAAALLTKTTALGLLPAVLCAAVISREGRPKAAAWAAALLPIVLLPLAWWIRNQHLYGDPFAMGAFKQAFVGSPQAQGFISDPSLGLVGYLLSWVLWWTARSFFGAFGYMDIWLNETGSPVGTAPNLLYRLLLIGTVLSFIGWLASLKTLDEWRDKAVHIMNVLFVCVVLLLFLSFELQYFQAQARYLLPAIGPISCGFAWGIWTLCKRNWMPALAAITLILGGTTMYAAMKLPAEFDKRTIGAEPSL